MPLRRHALCLQVLASYASCLVSAQFPPDTANLTTVRSPVNNDVSISYKSPDGACRTAFSSQKQYTGWVNVPGDYPTNLFFWFVAAREPADVLTIWLNGGPGSTSLFGMFNGVGPCSVVEKGLDEYETLVNEWGWDRASNMLFIDQPNQVGFSFDTPTNGSLDLLTGNISYPASPVPSGQPSYTYLNGTFSSPEVTNTANTTSEAGIAVWHLLQAFLAKFPEYNPPGGDGLGINLFAESYGGKYGPVFADVWSKQNEKRRSNQLPRNSTLEIKLASLGIINGCVDDLIQTPSYPAFANGNTYGFQGFSSVLARHINASLYSNDGCLDLIEQCRTAQGLLDQDNTGGVDSVNSQCSSAYTKCYKDSVAPFADSGRSFYDIASTTPDSFPPSTYIEYLNQPGLQKAIGAVTNFTSVNPNVMNAFLRTGDFVRGPLLPGIARLLTGGVRVALVYGDRDYICNWMGGEAIADAIAQQSPDTYGARYEEAGHAPIIVNDSYIGGVVRQYGNLSFSRIYQAGHAVPAYQPETAFQVFARIIMGTSISTGDKVDLATYMTEGESTADEHKDDLPDAPSATCWIRNKDSCSSDQMQILKDGKGVVINGVLYSAASEWPLATKTTAASTTMSTTSATNSDGDPSAALSADLTGVYTATSTPDNAANSGPLGRARSFAIFAAVGVMIWIW